MARAIMASIAVLTLAACNDIASPVRSDYYDPSLVARTSTGALDTLVFSWPRSDLPVRVWVADTSVLKPYVSVAIERWQHAFLYGEWRAVEVTDSTHADIIVISGLPQDEGFSARAIECSGATDAPDPDTNVYPLPIHIWVFSTTGIPTPGLDTCYDITVTHEFGHAIGIFAHSPNSSDVMYANPTFDGISDADRQTAEVLYLLPPTVVPGTRP